MLAWAMALVLLLAVATAQECQWPYQRCICSSANPFCQCAAITASATLNSSSSYVSHLVAVSGFGCQPCSPQCLKCSSLATCQQCQPEFYLSGSLCLACPVNCATCSGGICSVCIGSYYLDSKNDCQLCPLIGTAVCTINALKSCLSNYWLDNNGAVCVLCSPNCLQCASTTRCQQCEPGYYATLNGICTVCLLPCRTCQSAQTCLECLDPTQYYSSSAVTCTSCPVSGCYTCLSSTTCKVCQPMHALTTAGQCTAIPSASIIQNCDTYSTSSANQYPCSSCSQGLYYNVQSNACFYSCSLLCSTCRGPHYGQCLSCMPDTNYYNLHCIPVYNVKNGAAYQLYYTAANHAARFVGSSLLTPIACRQQYVVAGSAFRVTLTELAAYKFIIKWKAYVYCGGSTLPTQTDYSVGLINRFGTTSSSHSTLSCNACSWASCISYASAAYEGIVDNINTIVFSTNQCSIALSELLVIGFRCGGVMGQNCLRCSDINNCVECINPRLYLLAESCVVECPPSYYTYQASMKCYRVCPPGTYANDEYQICAPCVAPCLNCLSATQCLSCQPGTSLFTTFDSCVIKCPPTFYSDPIISTCRKCLYPCLECTGPRLCLSCVYGFLNSVTHQCQQQCQTGFYGNLATGTCEICLPPCTRCASIQGDFCLSCTPPLLLSSDKCVSVCPVRYYPNLLSNSCQPCHVSCLTCLTTSEQCASCPVESYLSGTNCLSKCLPGFFANDVLLKCVDCPSKCSTCISNKQCLSCQSGFFLTEFHSSCTLSCQWQYYPSLTKCLRCDSLCRTCTRIQACTACKDRFLENGACLNQCSLGYYTNAMQCLPCFSSCLACQVSSNICSSCKEGFYLTQNRCGTCEDGYFPDSQTKTCRFCPEECNLCISLASCSSCAPGYALIGQACAKYCPDGKFMATVGDQATCSDCQADCQSCLSSTVCITCWGGFLILNGNCFASCPSGFFLDQNKCTPCLPPCKTCLNTERCLSCLPGFGNLLQQMCVETCPQSLFNKDQRCEPCLSECRSCQSLASCTICGKGLFMKAGQGCVATCGTGLYVRDNSNCQMCNPTCATCAGTQSSCLSCVTDLILQQGRCLKDCSNGFYKNGNNCAACAANCQICRGALTCLLCNDNWFRKSDSTCAQSCPVGSYQQGQACSKCNYPCKTCVQSRQCTSCLRGFLVDGDCTLECPLGTFESQTTSKSLICGNCGSNCLECLSLTQCLRCQTGNIFNGACVSSCPLGYFTESGECSKCLAGCTDCSNSYSCNVCSTGVLRYGICVAYCPIGEVVEAGHCKQCVPGCSKCMVTRDSCLACSNGLVLYLNKCLNSCPIGSYQPTGVGKCISCISPCDSCSNGYSCDSCIKGFILYREKGRSQCVEGDVCPNSYYHDMQANECVVSCDKTSFVEAERRTCAKQCSDQFVTYSANNSCLVRCPQGMWIDGKLICQTSQSPSNLPILKCEAVQVRNVLTLRCDTKSPISNLNSLTRANFTSQDAQIVSIFVTSDNEFFIALQPIHQKMELSNITFKLTYRYGLKAIKPMAVSQSSTRLQNTDELANLSASFPPPMQSLESESFVIYHQDFSPQRRETGMYLYDVAISVSIAALATWAFSLLRNIKLPALLLILDLQWLYVCSLSQCLFQPNVGQLLEGFKISMLLVSSSVQTSPPLWNVEGSKRAPIYIVSDFQSFESVKPSLLVCVSFIGLYLLTLIGRYCSQSVTMTKKFRIINERCQNNYPKQCLLLVLGPCSSILAVQSRGPIMIPFLVSVGIVLIATITLLRSQLSESPRNKLFTLGALLDSLLLPFVAVWLPSQVYLGVAIIFAIINLLLFWRLLIKSEKECFQFLFNFALRLITLGIIGIIEFRRRQGYLNLWSTEGSWILIVCIFCLIFFAIYAVSKELLSGELRNSMPKQLEELPENSPQEFRSDGSDGLKEVETGADFLEGESFFTNRTPVTDSDDSDAQIVDFDFDESDVGHCAPKQLIRIDNDENNSHSQ